ncbi:hypothetical protein [Luteococcus sp. OSA5]|uniref:divisome protein SepX/GlpR n=1 Tax=Luteococcus sp. OSA5 TaxID=3401630 RepID=UPI003B427AFD
MTGLIFVAIALAWLAYLVPSFLAHRDHADVDELDPMERFSQAVQIVAPSSFRDESEVSTPLMRRAARAEIHRTAKQAARRRRTVLLVLLSLTVIATISAALGAVIWYTPLVPGALTVGFLALCRFSVVRLNARLDARLAEVEPDWREDTVSFEVPAQLREGSLGEAGEHSTELSIEISAPIDGLTGSLWDPIPITVPTYVSKPLVPRTVRTIDLSAPEPTQGIGRAPIVAEALERDEPSDEQPRKAVGE